MKMALGLTIGRLTFEMVNPSPTGELAIDVAPSSDEAIDADLTLAEDKNIS